MTPETIILLKETAGMFAFLLVELTGLFLLISYFVGVLQMYVPPEKIRSILSSKHGKGYFVAALLGAITPFCSCSTIPFLKGLLRAKAGFGPMMVFLFASPLLNPIVIALFIATFGLQIALLYFSLAMGVSVIAGYVLEKLKFDKYIIPFTSNTSKNTNTAEDEASCCATTETTTDCCSTETEAINSCSSSDTSSSCSTKAVSENCCSTPTPSKNKWREIWDEVWIDFKTAFPYLLIGVTLGAIIHGFVPTDFITKYASEDNPLAIPFAAVVGIPLYLRAIALIPLSAAFVAKGMGIGAVMAFIIGSAGASIPEVILLRSMFKTEMILAFLAVVLGMAVLSGFIFNFLF